MSGVQFEHFKLKKYKFTGKYSHFKHTTIAIFNIVCKSLKMKTNKNTTYITIKTISNAYSITIYIYTIYIIHIRQYHLKFKHIEILCHPLNFDCKTTENVKQIIVR